MITENAVFGIAVGVWLIMALIGMGVLLFANLAGLSVLCFIVSFIGLIVALWIVAPAGVE